MICAPCAAFSVCAGKSPVVFTSSNVKDYAGENGSVLRPDLAAELAKLGMEYAPNLSAAKRFLGF